MDQPGKLLSSLLNQTSADQIVKRQLNSTFSDFLKYYGAIRHFGKNLNDRNYEIVQGLTITKLDHFREMTIQIWDLVIGIYRQDNENDFDYDVVSVVDIVSFNQLAYQQDGGDTRPSIPTF